MMYEFTEKDMPGIYNYEENGFKLGDFNVLRENDYVEGEEDEEILISSDGGETWEHLFYALTKFAIEHYDELIWDPDNDITRERMEFNLTDVREFVNVPNGGTLYPFMEWDYDDYEWYTETAYRLANVLLGVITIEQYNELVVKAIHEREQEAVPYMHLSDYYFPGILVSKSVDGSVVSGSRFKKRTYYTMPNGMLVRSFSFSYQSEYFEVSTDNGDTWTDLLILVKEFAKAHGSDLIFTEQEGDVDDSTPVIDANFGDRKFEENEIEDTSLYRLILAPVKKDHYILELTRLTKRLAMLMFGVIDTDKYNEDAIKEAAKIDEDKDAAAIAAELEAFDKRVLDEEYPIIEEYFMKAVSVDNLRKKKGRQVYEAELKKQFPKWNYFSIDYDQPNMITILEGETTRETKWGPRNIYFRETFYC